MNFSVTDEMVNDFKKQHKKDYDDYKFDLCLTEDKKIHMSISINKRKLTYEEHLEFQENHPDKIEDVINHYIEYLNRDTVNSSDPHVRLKERLKALKEKRSK